MEIRLVNRPKDNSLEEYEKYLRQHLISNKEVIGNINYLTQQGYHVRCTGISTLIALSIIHNAIKYKGELQMYVDHFKQWPNHGSMQRYVARTIDKILTALPEYNKIRNKFDIKLIGLVYENEAN